MCAQKLLIAETASADQDQCSKLQQLWSGCESRVAADASHRSTSTECSHSCGDRKVQAESSASRAGRIELADPALGQQPSGVASAATTTSSVSAI
ncbi:unnamed protein product [Phytophthora fragariaefolia]|uniref:Unnamed protein product n=1 Tax=Phytophthora fragariaefolia TaxID=1490495 RepID=A0A9W7CV17_9STRA|nr:unnamed protein product [Phytophthora fragariaefolia]